MMTFDGPSVFPGQPDTPADAHVPTPRGRRLLKLPQAATRLQPNSPPGARTSASSGRR